VRDSSPDKLKRFGLIGTVIYFLVLAVTLPLMMGLGWIKLEPIELNQAGDFLAGSFGPLAIFWLVLGFFQQGEELKNSVATLQLQAKELASSVEQQRELVQVTRESLDHERSRIAHDESEKKNAKQARFIVTAGGGSQSGHECVNSFQATNIGSAAAKVIIEFSPPAYGVGALNYSYWDTGKREDFGIRFEESGPLAVDRF
jgi:hypothetical protein